MYNNSLGRNQFIFFDVKAALCYTQAAIENRKSYAFADLKALLLNLLRKFPQVFSIAPIHRTICLYAVKHQQIFGKEAFLWKKIKG